MHATPFSHARTLLDGSCHPGRCASSADTKHMDGGNATGGGAAGPTVPTPRTLLLAAAHSTPPEQPQAELRLLPARFLSLQQRKERADEGFCELLEELVVTAGAQWPEVSDRLMKEHGQDARYKALETNESRCAACMPCYVMCLFPQLSRLIAQTCLLTWCIAVCTTGVPRLPRLPSWPDAACPAYLPSYLSSYLPSLLPLDLAQCPMPCLAASCPGWLGGLPAFAGCLCTLPVCSLPCLLAYGMRRPLPEQLSDIVLS